MLSSSYSPVVPPHLDPPIEVKTIALPVLPIQACPTVRLGDAALAQGHGQRQGRPRLRLCAYPRPMAQPRGGASTDGTTLKEVPQKIIKHNGFVTRPPWGRWCLSDRHTSCCALAAGTTRPWSAAARPASSHTPPCGTSTHRDGTRARHPWQSPYHTCSPRRWGTPRRPTCRGGPRFRSGCAFLAFQVGRDFFPRAVLLDELLALGGTCLISPVFPPTVVEECLTRTHSRVLDDSTALHIIELAVGSPTVP
jgi:hypothetical protein